MAKSATAPASAANQPSPLAQNLAARQYVLDNAIDQWLQLPSQTAVGNPRGQVYSFTARNVGLIKRFIIEVSGTIVQSASETLTRTAFGPANIFSNIILTDLNNIQRVNTAGWHLANIATARRQRAYAAAFTNDSPILIGNNINVAVMPSPVTTVQTFRFFYELPISYSDTDLRGAIYAATTGANVNIQLTVNPNFVVGSAGNPTTACYISSTTTDLGTVTMTIAVYQNHLDQIPMDPNSNTPILPLIDLAYAYMLINTVLSGLSANQENNIAYSNWRSFMSTMVIYDDFGSGTANPATTINYFAIQVANSTNIIKWDPYMTALKTREIIGDDFPAQQARSMWYFDHRVRPINTDQYGNQLWIINPATVQASTSQVLIGFEMLATQNNILNASSPAKY